MSRKRKSLIVMMAFLIAAAAVLATFYSELMLAGAVFAVVVAIGAVITVPFISSRKK